MSTREQILEEIQNLSEAEVEEVAEYVTFLKYRSQNNSRVVDESQLASLYAEFAEEDRNLAEENMEDYAEDLLKEDVE